LRVVEKVKVIALGVLGVLRKISGTVQKELESPRWRVVIPIAEIVEAAPNLQQSSLGLQQKCVHTRIGLAHSRLSGGHDELQIRLVRMRSGRQSGYRIAGSRHGGNRDGGAKGAESGAGNIAAADN